jgi:hypothetical protein
MAPARMVSFIEEHADNCEICRRDPDLQEEIAKITELILPESKIPKAVRQKSEEDEIDDEDAVADEEDEEVESDDSTDEEEVEDEDELELDDDDDDLAPEPDDI